MGRDRQRLQLALRIGALAFVVAWLLSSELQLRVPFWVPFAILLAAEVEFVVRGWRERGATHEPEADGSIAGRRAPGTDDADLGWGALVEGEDGLRYVPPPRRARRPRRHRALTVAAVVLAAGLFVAAVRVERSRTWRAVSPEMRAQVQARLSREASLIAGRAVTVRCDVDYTYTGIGSDALGVAFIQRGLAYLHPSSCRALYEVLQGDRRGRDATGEAVLVLAHEAVHLAGERDEGITECRGLQHGVTLGRRLGLPPGTAERLMAELYRRNLADRGITRIAYRLPAGCRNGGELDLRPGDASFP